MENKFIIIVISIAVSGCSTSNEKASITNYRVKGSLESTKKLSCIELSSVSSLHTPADIYPAVIDCINKNEFEKAAELFALAGTYGRYDQLRVSDKTSRQAVRVLQTHNFSSLTDEEKQNFSASIKSINQRGSEKFIGLCSKIIHLGKPEYYPDYMIKHGISAFTGKDQGISESFNEVDGWNDSIKNYLHCEV